MIVGADLVDVIDLEPLGNWSIEINPDQLLIYRENPAPDMLQRYLQGRERTDGHD
jgi:hypothetical protein